MDYLSNELFGYNLLEYVKIDEDVATVMLEPGRDLSWPVPIIL